MKIRNGFVSNSSSSSFILDARNPEVQKLLPQINSLPKPYGLDRCTAAAIGEDAIVYANEWNRDAGVDRFPDNYPALHDLGSWILHYAKEIGEDNVVFVRESDEGMGGMLSNVGLSYLDIDKLAIAEREYH